jgi:hypothetical protein
VVGVSAQTVGPPSDDQLRPDLVGELAHAGADRLERSPARDVAVHEAERDRRQDAELLRRASQLALARLAQLAAA